MANDELYTPKALFDKLGLEFDLDVASSYNENIATPTTHRFTIEDDALSKEWFGRVWMNPPFSKPSPWVDKWLKHGNGVMLTPLGGNGRWLQKAWDSEAAVVCMPPNVGFINTDGEERKIMYRIALWALGEDNIAALSNMGKVR